MLEQENNSNQKQTPFLKRVSDMEKCIELLKKEVSELKKQIKTLKKAIKK